jgi:TRAP-type C4-dicarboxylate transport system substrate-binding protein/beta-lactamase regulating signal transducer with metallopeptidase domain
MKSLTDVIRDVIRLPVIDTLGWTLLHFLWQGALIALILAALMWLLKNQHPSLRYGLACGGLALMFVCPIITYLVLDSSKPTKPLVETQLLQADVAQPVLFADNTQVQPAPTPVVFAPEGGTGTKKSWLEQHLKPLLPYLVVFWGMGVLVLSVRLLGGLWILRKLRTHLTKPVSTVLMAQLNNVAERLGLARQVQLRESLVATVPLVVGWVRPMILLPSSVISGLSVKQLEMILAHELAHIRRHDYLVNLLQSVIETLLFYHPAVWWVSNQIRKEREHCCDDLAVKVCGGDKQSYARALADLEDLRPKVQLAQAASGGSLLKRIIRLADKALPKALEPRQWLAGLSMISISMILFTIVGASLIFAQDDEITLRLALADQSEVPQIQPYVTEFIEQVKTLSNGKITIEPFYRAGDDTEIGYEAGVIEHVTKNDFELGLAASRSWDNVTSLQALQAPFLIDNDALAEAVATSDTTTKMLESLSLAGVVGLTLWPEELRHPFAFEEAGKTFLSPEDFAGTTIRINESSMTRAIIEALGATPIFKDNFGQDVIDGRIQGAESGLRGAFISLPAPAIVTGNVSFFSKYQVLFANGSTFERLSDEQQSILRDAAVAAQTKAIAEHLRDSVAATKWCDNSGTIVLASEEQLAAFEKAAQPVYDLIEQDPQNAEYMAAIRELKASTAPSAGAAACEPPIIQASSTPSSDTDTEAWSEGLPPNGIWQVELNEEDLVAKGLPRYEAQAIAGVTNWEFQDGQFTQTMQINRPGAISCAGTYELVEDFVRFTYDNSSCEGGEVDDIQWRLDNDGLHLHLVAIQNAPFRVNKFYYETNPWKNIETWSKGLPPNGIWQVDLTAEDLEAVGLPQSSAVDWASKQTLTLLDGEGIWFFQRPDGNIYCKNTYAVVDDVVRFDYAADCTGQVHDMQWRLEDDGLHLQLVDSQNAPEAQFKASLAAKPWQKIGEPIPDTRVWDKGLPPNGTWQAEATPEDFLALGFVPSYAALLGGVYTWTFQDGKATFQSETQDSVAFTADYAVVGDAVRFNFTSGPFGQDSGDMQWRLDDDGLHMHVVEHPYNFHPDDVKLPSVFLDFGGHFEVNTFKKIE